MHSINIHWIEKQGLRTWSWQGTHSPSHSMGMRTQAPGLQASTEWASSGLLKEREASPWIRFKIPKFVLFYTAQIYWAKDIIWGGAGPDGLAENTIHDHFWSSTFPFLFFKSKELAPHSSISTFIAHFVTEFFHKRSLLSTGRRSPDHGQEASSSPVFFLPLPASYITHTDRAPLKPEQQINTGSTQGRAPGSEGQSLKIQVNKQTSAFCKLWESHFTSLYLGFPT